MERFEIKRSRFVDAMLETLHQEQPTLLTVGQVMTNTQAGIGLSTSVLDLIELIQKHRYRHFLVTGDDGRLVGVISDRDVLRQLGPSKNSQDRDALAKITAEQIMSTDLVTVGVEATLDRAIELLLEYGISCIPVISNEVPVGILTATDLHILLQTLLRSLPELKAIASS